MTRARAKLLFFALVILPACAALTPAQTSEIARDAIEYAVCNSEAHECKLDDAGSAADCWAVYDRCVSAHGLNDGGRE